MKTLRLPVGLIAQDTEKQDDEIGSQATPTRGQTRDKKEYGHVRKAFHWTVCVWEGQ